MPVSNDGEESLGKLAGSHRLADERHSKLIQSMESEED